MNSSFWEGVAWTLVTIALAVCMAWIVVGPPWVNGVVGPLWVGAIKREIREARRVIIMSQQAAVDAVTAKLTKVEGEVVGTRDALVAEIQSLKDQIAAGTPAPELDLSGLESAAQRLDDLTPDDDVTDEEPVDPDFGVDHPVE